jgi:hypothetical protein
MIFAIHKYLLISQSRYFGDVIIVGSLEIVHYKILRKEMRSSSVKSMIVTSDAHRAIPQCAHTIVLVFYAELYKTLRHSAWRLFRAHNGTLECLKREPERKRVVVYDFLVCVCLERA